MFAWENARPIGHGSGYNPSDYTLEGDGLMYAFQEAFSDLAEITGMFADANTKAVNAYAKGYHNGGGYEAAQEAANAFMNSSVVKEGFFGDIKNKLIKLWEKLKEKIKAFFHSAIQYFDKWFKSEAAFAEKYEDEINDKELDGFKYKLFDWDLSAFEAGQAWKKMTEGAFKAAKNEGLVMNESYSLGHYGDWVDGLVALMEVKYLQRNDGSIKVVANDNEADQILISQPSWHEISASKYSELHNAKHNRWQGTGYNLGGQDSSGIKSGSEKQAVSNDSSEGSSEEETAKDSSASTVKSMTTGQRKAVQRAVMAALGYADSSSIENFKKSIAKKLRGGKTEPREKEPNMSDIISGLKDYKEGLDNIQEAQESLVSDIDDEIDRLKDLKSDAKGDEAKKYKNRSDVLVEAKNVYMVAFNVYKDGLKERGTQYKNCLSAALHYSKKND